jgi:LDH2 family malate/lactate/ureidoglycolate dehydrogenase
MSAGGVPSDPNARQGEPRVDPAALRAIVGEVFGRCGMGEADAALLADSLVFADLGGVHSHGVLRVPEYVAKLAVGGVNPRGRPRVVRDDGACLVVDGDNSMGQIGLSFAMEQAMARAETTGLAAVSVRGSNHCGALGYFATMALPREMIGLATTNALPTMAPWGGAERILGINPLAVALPARTELPIVYDAAFSGSAHGKIRVYQQKGLRLPEGWALDQEGRPTTDPAAALAGLLLPIGGFKGAGLALIMGVLSSLLSGAAFGTELGDMEAGPKPGRDGHFALAIRISAFADVEEFKNRVDRIIRQIHQSRRAPGVERLYVPGEIEALNRQANERDGIPLNAITLGDLRRAAQELGVDARGLLLGD